MPEMRMAGKGLVAVLAAALLICWGNAAWAQSTEARDHYRDGMRYKRQGDLPRAIAELEAAVEADDKYGDAWWALANIYQRSHEAGKAQKAFQKVIDLESKPERLEAARRYIEQTGGTVRGTGGVPLWVWITLVLIAVIVAAVFLMPRKKEEAAPALAPITLGDEEPAMDLDAQPEQGGQEQEAAPKDEMEQIIELIDTAPAKGEEFEHLAAMMGAAAIEDSANLDRMVDRLIPLLNSSDRDRRIKGYKLLSMFEGENDRIDGALESFDRSDITDAELEL